MTPMRRRIAEHMLESRRTSAHCTTIVEVDLHRVAATRRELKEGMARRGVPLTYLAFVASAVVAGLDRHPILNASIDGDELVYHEDVNLGIAVALESGLIVPVIRHAQRLSLEGLASEIARLAQRARSGELEPNDVAGGTFTITNPGQFGAVLATPIINQPQVGILDLEAIVKRPVVIDDESEAIAVRPMTNLCMSWDHRALDGAEAARFLGRRQGPARGVGAMSLLAHEEVVVRHGRRSGIYVVIAIHSTVLGPALGGLRLWRYAALGDAIADALRLSEAMTYKAAAAGLDLGGGKAVLCLPPEGELLPEQRRELMLDVGDIIESLDGRYVTAEDVGTGTDDMSIIRERTEYVMGLPIDSGGSGDPSPITARGVEAAIRASAEHRYGSDDLAGRRVTVVGLGHVGSRLAERLASDGAELGISDIDPAKRELAERLGARWLEPADAITADCELLAPCALGGAIDAENVERLRCEIVCGAANNVLADRSLASGLAERGILYAPDFIANAGGLINVYGELHSLDRERLDSLVDGIGEALRRVFETAEARSVTPLEAARALAEERLDAARGIPALAQAPAV